jgi:hypothetical protein
LVGTSPMGDPSRSSVRSGPALTRQIGNRAWLQESSIDTLNEFADMTGGKAFYNTNDLASSFRRAADDASSYYLAGYYLDTRNNHAGWRPLKVKVDRRDTEIRARKGFFVTNATIHLELTRGSDLSYALVSPIDGTGVPITVKWLGTSGGGVKRTAEFQIHLPPNGVAITGSEGQNRFNFDVAATAFLDNGKSTHPAAISETVTGSLTGAQMAVLREQGISFQNTLELRPGQYTVRVVVRDNATGKVGSVTAPLTVN